MNSMSAIATARYPVHFVKTPTVSETQPCFLKSLAVSTGKRRQSVLEEAHSNTLSVQRNDSENRKVPRQVGSQNQKAYAALVRSPEQAASRIATRSRAYKFKKSRALE